MGCAIATSAKCVFVLFSKGDHLSITEKQEAVYSKNRTYLQIGQGVM